MNEVEFHKLADNALDRIFNALELADAAGDLEVDYQAGIITLVLNNNAQFILNKHAPTRQIWLSSPLSGGLHFSHHVENNKWQLAGGKELNQLLARELKELAGVEVEL